MMIAQENEEPLLQKKRIKRTKIFELIISLINSLVNVSQIIIAFSCYQNGVYKSYFILFCISFGLKEIANSWFIYQADKSSVKQKVTLILLDVFQLGFLSPFIFKQKLSEFDIKVKISCTILYQCSIIFQDMIYFFALGFIIDDDTIVGKQMKIFCFLSFILRNIYTGTVSIIAFIQNNDNFRSKSFGYKLRKLIVYCISFTSYSLSIAQILMRRDHFEINIGYYFLAIYLSFNIFQIIRYGIKTYDLAFLWVVFPLNFLKIANTTIIIQRIIMFQYLCQIMNTFFILSYSNLNQDQELVAVSYFLSLVLVSLYFLLNTKKFLALIFKFDRFEITNRSQVQNVIQQLTLKSSSYNQTSIIFIEIYVPSNTLVCADQKKLNDDCLFYQLHQRSSLLKGKVKKLKISFVKTGASNSINYVECRCSIQKLLTENEVIDSTIDVCDLKLSSIKVNQLILERAMRGFLFTNLTEKIIMTHENENIYELKQNTYQVIAYNKQIRNIMICNPVLVLYDLYK